MYSKERPLPKSAQQLKSETSAPLRLSYNSHTPAVPEATKILFFSVKVEVIDSSSRNDADPEDLTSLKLKLTLRDPVKETATNSPPLTMPGLFMRLCMKFSPFTPRP